MGERSAAEGTPAEEIPPQSGRDAFDLDELLSMCADCDRRMPWGFCPGLNAVWPEIPACIVQGLGANPAPRHEANGSPPQQDD